MAPENNSGRQGRERNPGNNQKNLPGILPGHPHPHGRSYSLPFLTTQTRDFIRFSEL
jgi:hypothetical protein